MGNKKEVFVRCKDYLVSGEEFDLVYNSEYDLLQTVPVPLEENLSKYYQSEDYISHTDSQTSFVDKIYQRVKRYMLWRKERLVSSFCRRGKLLDIGCGTGDFLQQCNEKGWEVFGVEPEEKARKRAIEKLEKKPIIFDDIDKLPHQKFDVITLWHVLEHIPNTKSYIKKLSEQLNRNGILLIAVPNFKSYDAKYYHSFWAAYDVPRHLWHFSKTAIQKLFSEQGFELIKTKPMPFDAFYISLLSEKHKTGKTNLIKAFFIGLLSNINSIYKKEPSSRIYILKKSKKSF